MTESAGGLVGGNFCMRLSVPLPPHPFSSALAVQLAPGTRAIPLGGERLVALVEHRPQTKDAVASTRVRFCLSHSTSPERSDREGPARRSKPRASGGAVQLAVSASPRGLARA